MLIIERFIYIGYLVVTMFFLTGCGSSNLNPKELSIDDFKWETQKSKCDGNDCYVLSLYNKSKYDIIGVYFSYGVKSGVSKSDLRVYDEFMSEHEGYIDNGDLYENITLIGKKNEFIKKGEKLTDLRFAVGYENNAWYDYPTDDQFDLMEPKELQLGIVSGDKLYISYYDFQKKSWKIDEKRIDVNSWSSKEIGKQLSKPNNVYTIVRVDDEDEFEVYLYCVSQDMYYEYVDELKSFGYHEEDFSEYGFEGVNSLGYHIDVSYTKKEERLFVRIDKKNT